MAKKMNEWEAQNSTFFEFTSHIPEQREDIKLRCLDTTTWAWIDHDPDNDDGSEHTHFLVRQNGSRTVKAISDKFGIPSNFVRPCKKVTAFRRYMMHLDSPDKIKYSLGDIHTNKRIDFEAALNGNQEKGIFDLYHDYSRVMSGDISLREFIELNYIEFSKLSFMSKIKMFSLLSDRGHSDGTPN